MRRARFTVLAAGLCGLLASPALGAAADWRTLAETWLAAAYPEPQTRWEAAVLQAPAPTAEGAKILGARGAGRQPRRIVELAVLLPGADGDRPARLLIQADRFWTVAEAARPLARGSRLAAGDWRMVERNAAGLAADAVRDPAALEKQRTRKLIAAGEALTRHALEPEPEVLRGREVTLRVRGDGVVISTTARALEDGRSGESIRLQTELGRPVRALLLGPETAEIVTTRRP